MAQEPAQQTKEIIDRLRAHGHHAGADYLARRLTDHVGPALLLALREACQTVLTAIEAIDPATETLIEELRVGIETRLHVSDRDRRETAQ